MGTVARENLIASLIQNIPMLHVRETATPQNWRPGVVVEMRICQVGRFVFRNYGLCLVYSYFILNFGFD